MRDKLKQIGMRINYRWNKILKLKNITNPQDLKPPA